MTRVDFYLIRPDSRRRLPAVLCGLAAKACQAGHDVYLHTGSPEQARELDTLFWTFQDTSFLPHVLQDDPEAASTPVLLGWDPPPLERSGVLLNLAHPVPAYFSRFERVLEAVEAAHPGAEPTPEQAAARERYRFYQDRGYPLATHELGEGRGA